jgi:ABC-type lipoprotein export system ATPase subunit
VLCSAACEKLRSGGHIPAVIAANFVVHTGEIFVIMGLSGSGKSTHDLNHTFFTEQRTKSEPGLPPPSSGCNLGDADPH